MLGEGWACSCPLNWVKDRKTKEPYPGGPQGEFAKFLTEKIRGYGLATRASESIILSPPVDHRPGAY